MDRVGGTLGPGNVLNCRFATRCRGPERDGEYLHCERRGRDHQRRRLELRAHRIRLGREGALRGALFNERGSDWAYPVRQVTLASPAVEIAGGSAMTCARLSNGHVQCWGLAYQDDGYTVRTVVDGSNATLTDAVQVVASGASGAIAGHACARKSNGGIWCWGYGYYGELGNDSTGSFSLFPATRVGTIRNAIDVSVGLIHSCVLVSGGQVSCWGMSKMAIGSGNDRSTPITTPTAITGLNDAIDVESGWGQNCARRRAGQVSCWGINVSGELGDGTTSERTTVRNVVGLP